MERSLEIIYYTGGLCEKVVGRHAVVTIYKHNLLIKWYKVLFVCIPPTSPSEQERE